MIKPPKTPKLLLACQVALAGLLLTHQSASAASIVWQAPVRITGDTDVKTQGTLLGAYAFSTGAGGAAVSTVNTVPFITAAANTTQGYVTSAGAQFAYNSFNTSVAPYINLSYNYRQVLTRGLYSSAAPGMTVTLSGLTAGQTYMVQLWVNDSRGNNATPDIPQTQISFGTGTSPLNFDSAPVQGMEVAEVPGKLGQYVVGYLTMGASETSATLNVKSITGPKQINAIQIRTAANNTAWMADAKYGIMLHYQPGKNLMAPTDGGVGYSDKARVYLSPGPNKNESDWSALINNFNVTALADQAVEAGAGWVIISMGATSGYYNSYNSAYETIGGLQQGEFTPKPGTGSPVNGDLINALATALQARGISLFVYLAAEGPTYATTLVRHDGTPVKMQFLTKAAKDPSAGAWPSPSPYAWSPGAHPDLRTNMNAMISEWSTRWGAKVAGWWFDGCFHNTGYGANSTKPDNTLMGATAALANLDALVAAAKSGNPASLVAVNPGYNNPSVLTDKQDWLAGERGLGLSTPATPTPTPALLGDPHDKFSVYPTAQTITYGSKQVQWHNLSFMAWNWRDPRPAYVTEELISYISKVNSVGGVVTLDVDFTTDGQINSTFLQQLKKIKAALKPNTPADYQAPASFVNLALFKPSFFRSNAAGNIGDPELRAYGPHKFRANAGTDGDYRSMAEASWYDDSDAYYAYSYIVDLQTTQPIDKIVFCPGGHYATSYEIYYSTNGTSWSYFDTSTAYTASSNDIKVHNTTTPKTARYVKVKSLTPNAPGAYSVSMSISELEVYNTLGSASTAADTVWVDEMVSGTLPPGKTVAPATFSGTWNWLNTLAPSWNPASPGNYPFAKDGVRYHSSTGAAGVNTHGFTNTPALMKVGASDSLYCWVYIVGSQPTNEILLRWKATDGSDGAVRWGADTIPGGGYDAGSLPATDGWVKLSVPASNVGMGGKTIKGMDFAVDGGLVHFDRTGKTAP